MAQRTTRQALTRTTCGGFFIAALLLSGCGGHDEPEPPPPAVGAATLGAAGGAVAGPDGVRLVIPPDAVGGSTTFRIAKGASGAPALTGLNAASPIYEVTPHEQAFEQPAMFSLPRAAAQLADGEVPLLLKASPGGRWRVMTDNQRVPGALATDIDALSWFVLGTCGRTGATTGWIIGAVDCPSNHSLRLELLDSNGTPIAVQPSAQNTLPPLVRVTGPTTLNFRLAWTRPPGTTRADYVSVVGLSDGFRTGFTSSWGIGGNVQETRIDLVRFFTVTIDPAQVSGASLPGGRQLRVAASAEYGATALQVGVGNVAVGFEFTAAIPITVVYNGTQPTITQQPAPANVAVVENNSFTLAAAATAPAISYEWRYFQNSADTAVRAAEGVNNQASYSSPPAQQGWNGRLYYVQVCSNRGLAAIERCINSQTSSLTVSALPQPVAFTTQPADRDILEGESTHFTSALSGTPTPTLRWHHSVSCSNRPLIGLTCTGTPVADGAGSGVLAGATVSGSGTATLNLASVPLAASGMTWALAASQPGLANPGWSRVATLIVRQRVVAASFVQTLATPRSVAQNGSVDFSVQAAGTAPISRFWSIDGASVSAGVLSGGRCAGAVVGFPSEDVMRLVNVPLGCDGASISIALQNAATPAGQRPSSTALLNVTAVATAPAITAQPSGSTISEGGRATLTVGYSGTAPLTLSPQRLIGGTWGNTSSTTSATCPSPCAQQTPALQVTDNGAMFRVQIVNAQGSVDSSAVSITVNMARPPLFTQQPANAAADANLATTAGTAGFHFALGADLGSFAWQWLVNGQPLSDGAGLAGNGPLQQATVAGASGTLGLGTPGSLTLSNLPLSANGASLSVRVTRSSGGQSLAATSQAATLTVNTGVPANALTATQVVAGHEWGVVLRPDRTVWAWGGLHRNNGTVQIANLNAADQMRRPQRMYPAVLSDVHAISGWYDGFWALKGSPGTPGSRVLHWGNARHGADGRGTDGNGGIAGSAPQFRYNEAAPVEVLERVNNMPQPVDRVCSIAGGASRLLMIRAISPANVTTDCQPGSPKTVWLVGSLGLIESQSTGVAFLMPGLPTESPPAQVFIGQSSSGTAPLVIVLEDGRLFAHGNLLYNGLGLPLPLPGSGRVGSVAGPQQLPAAWGAARSLGMSFYYGLFAVRADGSVMTSGYNSTNELGLGNLASGTVVNGPLPVLAETCTSTACTDYLSGVSAIASNNGGTTLALKNGRLLGWGNRNNGLLGAGSGNQPVPGAVASTVSGLSALSSSTIHAMVIGPGGAVYSWGSGLRGALGDGVDGSSRDAPALVTVP